MIGPDLIYVHIPKTGGTTTEKVFGGYGHSLKRTEKWYNGPPKITYPEAKQLVDYYHPQHWTAHEMKLVLGQEEYDRKFRFTMVRNPWDRMVSFHVGVHLKGLKHKSEPLDRDEFNKYTTMVLSEDASTWDAAMNTRMRSNCNAGCREGSHYRGVLPCTDWFDIEDFHYVGRQETMDESLNEAFSSFERFTGKTLTKRETQRFNDGSSWRERDYRTYYSEETRRLVADKFASDIEAFGYEF